LKRVAAILTAIVLCKDWIVSTTSAMDHRENAKAAGALVLAAGVPAADLALWIQVLAGVGGLVFLYFQIRKARLEVKIRERELNSPQFTSSLDDSGL
jgi:hypothetical protein